jgi:hypothetical protein
MTEECGDAVMKHAEGISAEVTKSESEKKNQNDGINIKTKPNNHIDHSPTWLVEPLHERPGLLSCDVVSVVRLA